MGEEGRPNLIEIHVDVVYAVRHAHLSAEPLNKKPSPISSVLCLCFNEEFHSAGSACVTFSNSLIIWPPDGFMEFLEDFSAICNGVRIS